MGGLWAQADEVPHRIRIFAMRGGISFLGMDEGWEENRVPNEEDRGVVADEVPIALFRVELNRESARIACCVCAARLSSYLHWRRIKSL